MESKNLYTWKIVAGTSLAGFLGITIFALLPHLVEVYEKYSVLSTQNEQIEVMGNWKEQLSDLEEKQSILDEGISKMYVDLAYENEFSKIVEQTLSDAKESVVSIAVIQPTGETIEDAYNRKRVSLEFSGSYHSVARFVNRLEQNGLVIEVQDLSVQKEQNLDTRLNGSLNLEITMLRGAK